MSPEIHYRVEWEAPYSGGLVLTVEAHTREAALAIAECLLRPDVDCPVIVRIVPHPKVGK
jgi:hypothetical protein